MDIEKIQPEDLDKPIASRRNKRDPTDLKKQAQTWVYDDVRRKETKPKKSKERGWFHVENVIGHRVTRVKNKDQIELKVKWQDYADPTWEVFSGFVKDAGFMVERYLIKKSLMRPLQEYLEMKKLKQNEHKR